MARGGLPPGADAGRIGAMGSDDRLDGRVALVTGAGSPDGIGYATAARLADLGASVAIVSTTKRIHDRANELGVTGFVADLTDEAEVGALVDAIAEQLGDVSVLVNNAGLASKASPEVLRPVLKKLGKRAIYVPFDGAGHSFERSRKDKAADNAAALVPFVVEFVREHA